MEILPVGAAAGMEAELLDVYTACYAGCGGTWQRKPGYWRQALASHVFVELPYEGRWLVTLRSGGRLQAYALAGLRHGALVVLEAAARRTGAADRLWPALESVAREQGARATVLYGQDLTTPLYASARRAGFQPEPRHRVLVGRALRPEAICLQRWQATQQAPDVALEVWTPERALVLHAADGAATMSLEMKEEVLHQLVFARVDLQAAVREQRVTVREGTWDLVRQVAAVLHPVPWVYHHLDDI
jgi:hypothetical protein